MTGGLRGRAREPVGAGGPGRGEAVCEGRDSSDARYVEFVGCEKHLQQPRSSRWQSTSRWQSFGNSLRLRRDRDLRSDRPIARWVPQWRDRRFSSYSGLVRNRPVDEPDHDQVRSEDASAAIDDPLPRGARFGSAMHQVFETVDFAAPVESYYPICAEALVAQGFGDDQAVRLGLLVNQVLSNPLPDGTPLREAATHRQCELEVLLPVDRTSHDGLARAFAEHGGPWSAYANDIADIALPQGYFTGIIDLLFTHQGRVHLLDWKSNDLAKRGDYDQAAMTAEMRHHHYVLQYHLYAVALHRYLRRRLADYAYDRHVGSAHYVFVRGVDGSGNGWYQHRPSAAMIAALDRCFAQEGTHG